MYLLHRPILRSGGGFSPLELAPVAWYRFGFGVTSSGGLVSAWADNSGNNRHLLQATETNKPAVANGILSGDGNDNFLQASFTLAQPYTLAMVVRQDTWVLNEALCDGAVVASMAVQQGTTTPNLVLNAGSQTAENSDLAVETWGVVISYWNGASSSLQIDGGTATTGNPGTTAPDGFTLFAAGTPSNYAAASAAEVVIVSGAVTGESLTRLYDYLAAIRDTL